MAGKGGYQKPNNPAPVSGPGAMSKRTDGGPADPQPQRHIPTDEWGGSAEMEHIQQQAPMAGGVVHSGGVMPRPAAFNAPDDRPDLPVTAGANVGPGINTAQMLARHGVAPSTETVPDKAVYDVRNAYRSTQSETIGQLLNYIEVDGQ